MKDGQRDWPPEYFKRDAMSAHGHLRSLGLPQISPLDLKKHPRRKTLPRCRFAPKAELSRDSARRCGIVV
jgi:hypothetical protein